MSDRNSEDIIGALYDMVQDARSMPLAADKCILERDKVLDMLDEIIAQLPAELKQSRTIVESRNELISQAVRFSRNGCYETPWHVTGVSKLSGPEGTPKGMYVQIGLSEQGKAGSLLDNPAKNNKRMNSC